MFIFFLLDEMIVDEKIDLMSRLWIPISVIQIIVLIFSFYFLITMLITKRSTYEYKRELNKVII